MSMILAAVLVWQLSQPVVWERSEPTKAEVIEMIRNVFPQSEEENAIKIAFCESQYKNIRSQAVYQKDDLKLGLKKGEFEESYGVFQIFWPVRKHLDKDRLLNDYKFNISMAYEIWKNEGGWRNWYNCSLRMKVK